MRSQHPVPQRVQRRLTANVHLLDVVDRFDPRRASAAASVSVFVISREATTTGRPAGGEAGDESAAEQTRSSDLEDHFASESKTKGRQA